MQFIFVNEIVEIYLEICLYHGSEFLDKTEISDKFHMTFLRTCFVGDITDSIEIRYRDGNSGSHSKRLHVHQTNFARFSFISWHENIFFLFPKTSNIFRSWFYRCWTSPQIIENDAFVHKTEAVSTTILCYVVCNLSYWEITMYVTCLKIRNYEPRIGLIPFIAQ